MLEVLADIRRSVTLTGVFGWMTQDTESMSTEGRTYILTKIVEDPCQCDDVSASSVPSLMLLPIPEVDRSSSTVSAPPLHVGRFSPTSSLGLHPPVRRTRTISGHVIQPPLPPHQGPSLQRRSAQNPPSK